MNEVVFDTKVEAEDQHDLDLTCHFAVHSDEPYRSQNNRWAIFVSHLYKFYLPIV